MSTQLRNSSSSPSSQQIALDIETPEGIRFSLPLASPILRFIAWTVDLLIIALLTTALGQLVKAIAIVSTDLAAALYTLSYLVVSTGYGMALEWKLRGQTVGKRLVGLRVVDADGLGLESSQVVIRNLLRTIDLLPAFYGIGGAACLVSARAQRLGDLAANTVVIRTGLGGLPDLRELEGNSYNSLAANPVVAARLRRSVSYPVSTLALDAVLRRRELEPDGRVATFAALATHFRELGRLPESVTRGVSDEALVRNAVQVLFQPDAGSQRRR